MMNQKIESFLNEKFPHDPSGDNPKGWEMNDDQLLIFDDGSTIESGEYPPGMEELFTLLKEEGLDFDEEYHGYFQLTLFPSED